MVDFAKMQAERKRDKAFRETDLGKLFYAFENAMIAYWREDANDRCSDKRLLQLDNKARATRRPLIEKLLEITNV